MLSVLPDFTLSPGLGISSQVKLKLTRMLLMLRVVSYDILVNHICWAF